MTGTLPKEGKKMYEEIYQKALKYYGGDKEMASKIAWAAVKKKYKKNPKTGKWEKRASETSWMYDNLTLPEVYHLTKVSTETIKNVYPGIKQHFEDRLDWDPDIKERIIKSSSNTQEQRLLCEMDRRIYDALLDKI